MLLFELDISTFVSKWRHNLHPRPKIPRKWGITCGSVKISWKFSMRNVLQWRSFWNCPIRPLREKSLVCRQILKYPGHGSLWQNEMNRALGCPPDTGFEIRALAVRGRARYLSVTEAPHNTNFHTWGSLWQKCQTFATKCMIIWLSPSTIGRRFIISSFGKVIRLWKQLI